MSFRIRLFTLLTIAAIFFIVIIFTTTTTINPKRPKNLPRNSYWVGGADGGTWISINNVSNREFHCKTFFQDGMNQTRGDYFLVDHKKETSQRFDNLYFDGRIFLDTEKRTILLPHGWVYYYHDKRSGLKIKYSFGKEKSPKVSFTDIP